MNFGKARANIQGQHERMIARFHRALAVEWAYEYVAVAKLQADAFVTLDEQPARQVESIVVTAPFEALSRPDWSAPATQGP